MSSTAASEINASLLTQHFQITGAIGIPIILALSSAGFRVRALTRSTTSAALLPLDVEVVEVDYTQPSQIEAVLMGQEVVISALGDTASAVAAQEVLIHAAVAVGVKRFFPSEFGSDTMDPRVRAFPFFADKIRHQTLLEELAGTASGFAYTILITGPFLDWGLSVVPFIVNVGTEIPEGETTSSALVLEIAIADDLSPLAVYDDGTTPFSTTRISTLARALLACLQPDTFPQTANRTLYIHDGITTQNRLLDLRSGTAEHAERRKQIDTALLEARAWRDYHDPSTTDPRGWVFPFITLSIWSRERLCCFEGKTDNALLGIPELGGEELQDVLKTEVERAEKAFAGPGCFLARGAGGGEAAAAAASGPGLAEKALEGGKHRLEGFGGARSGSPVEGVVGQMACLFSPPA